LVAKEIVVSEKKKGQDILSVLIELTKENLIAMSEEKREFNEMGRILKKPRGLQSRMEKPKS